MGDKKKKEGKLLWEQSKANILCPTQKVCQYQFCMCIFKTNEMVYEVMLIHMTPKKLQCAFFVFNREWQHKYSFWYLCLFWEFFFYTVCISEAKAVIHLAVYIDVCVQCHNKNSSHFITCAVSWSQLQMYVCDSTICDGSLSMHIAWKRNKRINIFLQYMWHASISV